MEATYEIKDGTVLQTVGEITRDVPIQNFLVELGKFAPFSTGWLPPGVRMYTQAGRHAQAVIVCEPGVNLTWWGEYEGDRSAKLYQFAQPYRVIIVDFLDNVFLGARMFYSPIPVNTPNTPLYHQNLPNINCLGYSGNAVGWVCLYHKDLVKQERPLGEKIVQTIERASGSEAYNNRNMDETDGTRFYESQGKPSYLWNPDSWETKSQEEGFEWTLDPDLWIPVLVKDKDTQGAHYPGGIPLTLGMAVEGNYQPFYAYSGGIHDRKDAQRGPQALRQDEEIPDIEMTVQTAFNNIHRSDFGKVIGSTLFKTEVSEEKVAFPLCFRCDVNPGSEKLGKFNVCKKCFERDLYCKYCEKIKRKSSFATKELCSLCVKSGMLVSF